MPMRTLLLAFALSCGATSLAAQSQPIPQSPAALQPGALALGAPVVDARLVIRAAAEEDAGLESRTWKEVVTRPWWHYPAIGAAIGIAAGVVQAKGMQDPIGFPIGDPVYVLPTLYGAAGAFVGILIDSADRERAARR